MRISPSRAAAFDVLQRVISGKAYASDLLHSHSLDRLSPADHALATEIALGVARWRSTLEQRLQVLLQQPLSRIDDEVLIALLIGAYQLLFLDRIPVSAAVNESVELVKRGRKRSAAGLANAILRKLAAGHKDLTSFTPESAHPSWMLERWKAHYGPATTAAICAFDQQKPITAIRFAPNHSIDDLERELLEAGVEIEPGRVCRGARRVIRGNVTATAAFRDGRLLVQDEASQLIALLVQNGTRVLDCCAAPGGKTSLIAARNPKARIVANERNEGRLRLLRQRVREPNVEFTRLDARTLPFGREFDRILADVPCSGTGTFARNPEIKWRLGPDDLADLAIRQREILLSSLACLAPGGWLIYSTCSLESEENQVVVEQALATDKTARQEDCVPLLENLESTGELVSGLRESLIAGGFLRTIPGVHDCEGFFAAVIRKTA